MSTMYPVELVYDDELSVWQARALSQIGHGLTPRAAIEMLLHKLARERVPEPTLLHRALAGAERICFRRDAS